MRRFLQLFVSALVLCSWAKAAEPIRLVVDDPADVKGDWPMTCGLPLPKGALRDAEAIRLADAGQEVPCQVDQGATWPDGSIRWVLLSFTRRTDGDYRVEYGPGVKRSPVTNAIRLEEDKQRLQVDTGPAHFLVPRDGALIAEATLNGKTILKGGGSGAYIVDNQGRTARLGGRESEMQVRVLRSGPVCVVLRIEGWYVVEGADATGLPHRPARGIVWLYFHAGSPCVKIVHRLVLTEDTNKLWFRDVGIEFPTALAGPAQATFDSTKAFDEKASAVAIADGESAWMIQDDYPHFMSKTSHFSLAHKTAVGEKEIASGEACGEWCDLSGKGMGLTVVLRDFAEQFPKEFTATPAGVTVHLWAGRCGRELDFRAATLAREYWGKWSNYAAGGLEGASKIAGNAQCSAKTHEIVLIPHDGAVDAPTAARQAHAAAKRVLVLPDPVWTCSTDAMGLPIHPKDVQRFPDQERLVSDFFDRVVLPYRVFPMTGYIAWGCNPYLNYQKDKKTGEWYAEWYRLRHLVDYNVRRNVWTLYARSAERKYFEYGERFNRFASDMEMHHWDLEGKDENTSKVTGGFAGGPYGDIHNPRYWANGNDVLVQNSSGTDIVNYLYQFYLTGDWHSREAAESFGQAMKQLYDMEKVCAGPSPFLVWRCIITLYTMDWDEQFGKMMRDVGRRIIDLNSPNALYEKMAYGCLYKVDRNVSAILDYWLITGDDYAKKGFLKAVDYQYRFQRESPPISYQNASGMYYAMAYRMTQRKEYLQLVNQSLRSGLAEERKTLAEDLAPGLDKLEQLPYRGCHLSMHPLFTIPVALRLLSEVQGPIEPFPLVLKSMDSAQAWAAFEKPEGKAVAASMYFSATSGELTEPVVLGPDSKPVNGIKVQKEQRIPYYADPGINHFYVHVEVPAELPAGTYRLGHTGQGPFTVMDATVDRMALECPEGVWLGGPGLSGGEALYFPVPDGLNEVRLFLGREVEVSRSDGSKAVDPTGAQIGEVKLPTEAKTGIWRVQWPEPALVVFRNTPPIVGFGAKERLFQPSSPLKMERPKPELPPAEATFVPGVIGQALQLNAKDVLRYARGAKQADGSYENFPGSQGTIELYFRPNWSTVDFPVLNRKMYSFNFLSAGSVQLYHRCGQGPMTTTWYAFVDLICQGPWGMPPAVVIEPCGNQARKFFRAGEWTHIAATWRVDPTQEDPANKAVFFVFIDGKKRLRTWSYPREFKSYKPFQIGEIAEWIGIGPGDGTFDELRVSDTVRYKGDFAPPKTPYEPDAHTKALFHFDGSPEGVGVDGKKLVVQYKDTAIEK